MSQPPSSGEPQPHPPGGRQPGAQQPPTGSPSTLGPGGPQEAPDPAMTRAQRRWLPIAVVVAIAALVAVVVIIVTSIGSSADAGDYGLSEAAQNAAPDVSQLAADAAQAADELDIEAGMALMCEPPTDEMVEALHDGIAEANTKAGGTAEKSLTILSAEQFDGTGAFSVAVEGQGELEGHGFIVHADAVQVGSSWCIALLIGEDM